MVVFLRFVILVRRFGDRVGFCGRVFVLGKSL